MLTVLPRTLFCFVLSFFIFQTQALAQQGTVEVLSNQPSSETYDLLKDSKGYIWIGHDNGISRYDGTRFITLQHPQQSSIAITGLLEDRFGRIWCHNFSGQIFYVKDLKLHLLTEYNHKIEQGFPRLTILGDELIATTVKGLFVYNLVTGKAKYLTIRNGTTSLTKVGNKVVCFNNFDMYSYEPGRHIEKLKTDFNLKGTHVASLQPVTHNDTFYLVVSPNGIYYKLALDRDRIKIHESVKTGGFINTISSHNNTVWINTKEKSYTTDGKEVIEGLSLSDVIKDNFGNRWMSSLKKGLCIQYNDQQIFKLPTQIHLGAEDIRQLHSEDSTLFLGTANGKLFKMTSPSSFQYVLTIPKAAGAIERIIQFDKNELLLAGSVHSFSYNVKTKAFKELALSIITKDFVRQDNHVYFATTTGVAHFTLDELRTSSPLTTIKERLVSGKATRCRSIALYADTLLAAYSDGVYAVHGNTLQQLLYNDQPIYATTIRTVGRKVLIGTFNQGLLLLEDGRFHPITEKDGLASNFIKDIKIFDSATWIIYADRFQQLNKALTGVENNAFTFSTGGINDFHFMNNQLYVATGDGVYYITMHNQAAGINTTTFIDAVTVNGQIISTPVLSHNQNYIHFQASTPFYSNHSKIIYQYRIKNARNSTWQLGAPGQTVFDVVALEPGDYEFEIVATDVSRKVISHPAIYRFEILPPWYQTWSFRILAGLAFAALLTYLVWLYYRSHLHKQRQSYESQLVIQAERQRISAEIHDDMGASLSAIRLLVEMTKNKLPENEIKKEIGKVHESISDLSNKMREVIWSLNSDNDSLDNLLHYIRRQAYALFENSPVNLRVTFPQQPVPAFAIKGEKRRHIYLSVKEALHNCLKHSGASNCFLQMHIDHSVLRITVTDNGRGFVPVENMQVGNGLTSMQKRMRQVNGLCEVQVSEQTEVRFVIPLNETS